MFKMSKKTPIDNRDVQYLGNQEELINMINKQAEKHQEPQFLILRSPEDNEVGLYSFEGRTPELEIPKLNLDNVKIN